MKRIRFRVPLTVLATILFLALSFEPSPSDPAVPDPFEQPPQDKATQIQDLTRWMISESRSFSGASRQFQAIRLEDFEAAAQPRSRERELTLFEPSLDPAARRRFLDRIPYGSAIHLAAERHRVDGLLLAAIVSVESRFTADAVSPRGAKGLMQVRPAVGEAYGAEDLFDPYANLDAGSRYLRSLMKDYKGDLELALAAYNAGPAAVARYGGVPPFRETREYVRKVLATYERYSRRAAKVPFGRG
jgi:soluble lytic murein transglycosylase-like protein